ncbi:MAG: HlyD family efflux transporter periplasmic adaptor subunit [Alphaproteobacteria bacterium]|nr:HlyD family efflux transporter periplasmic adaptor subunit [Alphaproteobacteria bacterium]
MNMSKITKRQYVYAGICAAMCIAGYVVYRCWFCVPFMYAGTLETSRVVLSARVASDVSQIHVAEGDTVSAGDALIDLSCDTQRVSAPQIDNDYNRIVELFRREHASQAELDAATARKNGNDLQLSWCHVTSPINGTVTTRFREVGEIVAPGTPLITISNPDDIWAYFYVPYDVLYKLRVGQTVTGILPEASNMRFSGHIVKISENAEFTPKNVQTREERMRLVYGVKVRFDNPDLTLKSGMTIESDLINE